jgi:hypothetical protein
MGLEGITSFEGAPGFESTADLESATGDFGGGGMRGALARIQISASVDPLSASILVPDLLRVTRISGATSDGGSPAGSSLY